MDNVQVCINIISKSYSVLGVIAKFLVKIENLSFQLDCWLIVIVLPFNRLIGPVVFPLLF